MYTYIDNWNLIRTAYTIAKLGTESAAASELNLHRATVMRHVDTLEEEATGLLTVTSGQTLQ